MEKGYLEKQTLNSFRFLKFLITTSMFSAVFLSIKRYGVKTWRAFTSEYELVGYMDLDHQHWEQN